MKDLENLHRSMTCKRIVCHITNSLALVKTAFTREIQTSLHAQDKQRFKSQCSTCV